MNAAVDHGALVGAVPAGREWPRHGAVLAGAVAILLILFRRDALDLLSIYWNSADYGHCLFVLPVAAWLVWQRRGGLSRLTPLAWWPGLIPLGAAALLWVVGEAAGAAILRHLALVTMAQALVPLLMGPTVTRGVLFPLAYCWFLVPFGASFQAPLQQLTADMAMGLLHATGFAAVSDGVLITTDAGYFEVAEACSGAGFVIAMIAFAVLAAHVGFVRWSRRTAFFAFAVLVPILANGVRAYSTIVAAHWTSIETATGFDHIVYGWFFFAFVILVVIASAWRWFDRDPSAPWFDPEALRGRPRGVAPLMPAAALSLALPLAAIAWTGAIAARADPLPSAIALPDLPGWSRVAMSDRAVWKPTYAGADHFLHGRYAGPNDVPVDLAIAVYGRQGEGRELVAFGQGAIGEDDAWVWIEDRAPLMGGHAIRMTAPGPVERQTVTWYRIGDSVTASPTAAKLATLRARLLGGRQTAVAILVSVEKVPGVDSRAVLTRFVRALGPIDRLADTVTAVDPAGR